MAPTADELKSLRALARALGVRTAYTDGLGRPVTVGAETLLRVCSALGRPLTGPADAADALRERQAGPPAFLVPPTIVAWNGKLPPVTVASRRGALQCEIRLEDGGVVRAKLAGRTITAAKTLPLGYHGLTVEAAGRVETAHVIAAPVRAFRRPGTHRSWGVGTQLAALRSARSRSVGDLADLEMVCRWIRSLGGDLVTVLPLLPTFNDPPPEPSPYSPVSRLFWSELILDLGGDHRPAPAPAKLDVTAADAEVRAALAGRPAPDPTGLDEELLRYARFRGAQKRLGRNWRDWPAPAKTGTLGTEHVDAAEERFHLVAQAEARGQLHDLRRRLERRGMRLGLDLAVGVHPDGYDPWSRQALFGEGMSVGAPPDYGFPSGQDWGFTPVLPHASRREGHRYVAASIGHQMELAGVLRVDHIMAWTRLYWIPHGMGLHEGTYVSYPADELFAVLTLESARHRCEVVGENLGTVPPEIGEALPRHRIWGMYLAQFEAPKGPKIAPPVARDMALVGTHDTPTFAGWIRQSDIADRLTHRLLAAGAERAAREERTGAVRGLAGRLKLDPGDPAAFFAGVLEFLGRSRSPLVVPWLEDCWLEDTAVNLPGTTSAARANWQRPMARLLDDVVKDKRIRALLRRLDRARKGR